MNPKLSIIISNRNDLSMLAVTIRSCIEELRPLGKGAGEIVVVDNSDEDIYQLIISGMPMGYCRDGILQIHRQNFPCLFTARETAAEKAKGEYILCLDSHMIVGRDCLLNLVNFMDRRKDDPTLGFAHAPLSWAHHHERNAKHDRDISVHELGSWGLMRNTEQTITWKGMPWICRRSWFLDRNKGLNAYGALAQHRVSWGGGDMHIGVKPWLLGFKNWAVPTNPCIHIGPFPKRDIQPGNPHVTKIDKEFKDRERYRLYAKSGEFPHTFGFLVSCYVLGGEAMMKRNKEALAQRFGKFIQVEKWWKKAIELGSDEHEWLKKRQVMSFEEFCKNRPWASTDSDIYKLWLSKTSDHRYFRPKRWAELKKVISDKKLSSVLEFGSGVSTLLFQNLGLKVLSLETNKNYMNFVQSLCQQGVDFVHWNGNGYKVSENYDLALVDGDLPRLPQIKMALKSAKIIAIDDFVGGHKQRFSPYLKNYKRIDSESTFLAIFEPNS